MVEQRFFAHIALFFLFYRKMVCMRIFISLSSSISTNKEYNDLTNKICTMLARCNHKLVFSGKIDGMSEIAYQTFKYEDKKTKAVVDIKDVSNVEELELDAYEVKMSTFERSKGLYDASEVILVLPGGIESISELLSMIVEKNSKDRDIPIIIYNYNNFYTPLLNIFTSLYKMRFIDEKELKLFDVVNDIDTLEKHLNELEKRN